MADKEIEVFETTAGQVPDMLARLGVAKERMVTVMIEPGNWLTKARQESRRLDDRRGLERRGYRPDDQAGAKRGRASLG